MNEILIFLAKTLFSIANILYIVTLVKVKTEGKSEITCI